MSARPSIADLSERLWGRVEPDLNSGCWLFAGVVGKRGYGKLKWRNATIYAHRAAYLVAHGRELSPKEVVCHRCDTPVCVNPAHLFVGTQADNMHDMAKKGRHRGSSKLTGPQVAEIYSRRAGGERGMDLAVEFGVSQATVSEIVHAKRYVRNADFIEALKALPADLVGAE